MSEEIEFTPSHRKMLKGLVTGIKLVESFGLGRRGLSQCQSAMLHAAVNCAILQAMEDRSDEAAAPGHVTLAYDIVSDVTAVPRNARYGPFYPAGPRYTGTVRSGDYTLSFIEARLSKIAPDAATLPKEITLGITPRFNSQFYRPK